MNKYQEHLRDQLLSLTPKQVLAVQALVDGSTHAEAAEIAGVKRETVTRWANHHPAFKATLNQYRYALHAEQLDKAQRIRTKALDVVSDALDDRDLATALAALKLIHGERPSGLSDPAAILDNAQVQLGESLPPLTIPRDEYGHRDTMKLLETPTSAERAEVIIIERLATESGIIDVDQG